MYLVITIKEDSEELVSPKIPTIFTIFFKPLEPNLTYFKHVLTEMKTEIDLKENIFTIDGERLSLPKKKYV
jgi:hypothetical protein